MVEAVGNLASISFALQIIVADPGGGIHGVLHVAGFDGREHLVVDARPYSRIEIGLQFKADTHLVRLALAHARHGVVCLTESPQQILYMVPYLVGYDIGIGEIASGLLCLIPCP